MRKSTYLSLIIVAAAAVVFIVITRWDTPSVESLPSDNPQQHTQQISEPKNSTLDCKSYKAFGLELSCPDGFYVEQYEAGDTVKYNSVVQLSFYNHNKPIYQEGSLFYSTYIGIYDDPYGASVDNYIDDSGRYDRAGQKTIGGHIAYSLKCKPQMLGCQDIDLVFTNGKVYEFINGNDAETRADYNSIVSSVKFSPSN